MWCQVRSLTVHNKWRCSRGFTSFFYQLFLQVRTHLKRNIAIRNICPRRFVHYSLSYQCRKPIILSTSSLSERLRTVYFRSALLHSPDTLTMPFPSSLRTITFNYSTMKWFIYSPRRAYLSGQPSSLVNVPIRRLISVLSR